MAGLKDRGGVEWNIRMPDLRPLLLAGPTATGKSEVALLLAEKRPDLIRAVAAISPAVWTSYAQARAANAGAYASAADFAADDAVTHAARLARVKVRVASGFADPFYPGVQALARALPADPGGEPAAVTFAHGCHDNSFFTAQVPPSLAFLARQLTVG